MSDIAINAVNLVPKTNISAKPSYLVTLEGNSKTNKRFITLDKPDMDTSCVKMKGVFTEVSEEVVIESYLDLLTSAPKETIIELVVPWHRVSSIRSLVFKAK